LYVEKAKEYDERLLQINQSVSASEQVDDSFYMTAKYILELARHSGELFERGDMLERKTLINTVLMNISWDGKKLVYDYTKPFDLLVNFQNNLNGVEDGTRTNSYIISNKLLHLLSKGVLLILF
jgi:hypothetical protein